LSGWERRRGWSPFDFELRISGAVAGKPFSFQVTPWGVKAEGVKGFPRTSLKGEREPLFEVEEKDGDFIVTAELPGVERENIDLTVFENKLRISAEGSGRKYSGEIELPTLVEPDSVKASYKNGLLRVVVRRAGRGRGVRINIE